MIPASSQASPCSSTINTRSKNHSTATAGLSPVTPKVFPALLYIWVLVSAPGLSWTGQIQETALLHSQHGLREGLSLANYTGQKLTILDYITKYPSLEPWTWSDLSARHNRSNPGKGSTLQQWHFNVLYRLYSTGNVEIRCWWLFLRKSFYMQHISRESS